MTRKEAREQAFIIIFEKEFNNEYSLDEIIEAAKDAELFDADEFAINIAKETLADIENLDSVISSNLKGGWRIGRISKVSLAILRLAICEMTKFNDIPVSVSINEAVELAKTYGGKDDASYINGVLSSVAKNEELAEKK